MASLLASPAAFPRRLRVVGVASSGRGDPARRAPSSAGPDARVARRGGNAARSAVLERAPAPAEEDAASRGAASSRDAVPDASSRASTSSSDAPGGPRVSPTSPLVVQLPSGERVTAWWREGPALANVADARTARAFEARLAEARSMNRAVCVEFFAGWCFACRSFHPKMHKLAAKEFSDCLFLRVHKDEVPELCDALGVRGLPHVRVYVPNEAEPVDAFGMNLTAPKLARFRKALNGARRGCRRGTDAEWGEEDQAERGAQRGAERGAELGELGERGERAEVGAVARSR